MLSSPLCGVIVATEDGCGFRDDVLHIKSDAVWVYSPQQEHSSKGGYNDGRYPGKGPKAR